MKKKDKPVRLCDLSSNHSRLKTRVVKQLVSEGSYEGVETNDRTLTGLLADIKKS